MTTLNLPENAADGGTCWLDQPPTGEDIVEYMAQYPSKLLGLADSDPVKTTIPELLAIIALVSVCGSKSKAQ